MLGSESHEDIPSQKSEDTLQKEESPTYDIASLLGKTSIQLMDDQSAPKELKWMFSIFRDNMPPGFGKGPQPICTGSLLFVNGLLQRQAPTLVQALTPARFDENTNRYTPKVRIAIGHNRYLTVRLKVVDDGYYAKIYPVWFTGIQTEPVLVIDSYKTNNTFVRHFQKSILEVKYADKKQYRKKERSIFMRHFSNSRTTIRSIPIETIVFNTSLPRLHIEMPQIILNCFIIIHHWIRHDLQLDHEKTDDCIEIKCSEIAYANPRNFYMSEAMPRMKTTLSVNLFSLENCINDWIYFWLFKKNHETPPNSFIDEMKALLEPINDGTKMAIELRKLVEYAISNSKHHDTRDIEIYFSHAKRALEMGVEKSIRSTGIEPTVFNAPKICNALVKTPEFKFNRVATLTSIAIKEFIPQINEATKKTILEMFLNQSTEIRHMSMLQKGDYILIDKLHIAEVINISLVDACLSEFKRDILWRKKINHARLSHERLKRKNTRRDEPQKKIKHTDGAETRGAEPKEREESMSVDESEPISKDKDESMSEDEDESTSEDEGEPISEVEEEQDTQIKYMTERMKELLSETNKSSEDGPMVRSNTQSQSLTEQESQSEELTPFMRKDTFFAVYAIQLTYMQDDKVYNTVDFTRIQLIGSPYRPIGHTKLNLEYDASMSVKCVICAGTEVGLSWLYSTSCGHLYHEACANVPALEAKFGKAYTDGICKRDINRRVIPSLSTKYCAFCGKHTNIQRKGGASGSQ